MVRGGGWSHSNDVPTVVPDWAAGGFEGTVVESPAGRRGDVDLIVRAVAPVEIGNRRLGHVIVDVPVDAEVLSGLYETTGVKAGAVRLVDEATTAIPPVAAPEGTSRLRSVRPRRHDSRRARLGERPGPPRGDR